MVKEDNKDTKGKTESKSIPKSSAIAAKADNKNTKTVAKDAKAAAKSAKTAKRNAKAAEKNAKFAASETKKKYDRLELPGGEYKTNLNKMYRGRQKWIPENPKHILSFMPGTVIEYSVSVGDEVRAGDTLLFFKAMKMNNRMLAPLDGRVKAINIAAGDNVAKNVVLMELE